MIPSHKHQRENYQKLDLRISLGNSGRVENRPICEPIALPEGVNVLAEVVRHGPQSAAPPRLAHFHALCEIVWFRRCEGSFIAEAGSETIGDGSAVFVPSMHMHDFALNAGTKEWVLIQFEPFLVDPIKGRLDAPLFDRSFVGYSQDGTVGRVHHDAHRLRDRAVVFASLDLEEATSGTTGATAGQEDVAG